MVTTTSRPTFMERLNKRLAERRNGEQGLALLDVLIGMAIFALISIIAISAIGQFRARAFESGALSDARAIGVAAEAQFTDNQAYPADATELQALVTMTKNNTVASYTDAGDGTFSFCVEHKDGAYAEYDSAAGGVTGSGRDGGCPTGL